MTTRDRERAARLLAECPYIDRIERITDERGRRPRLALSVSVSWRSARGWEEDPRDRVIYDLDDARALITELTARSSSALAATGVATA